MTQISGHELAKTVRLQDAQSRSRRQLESERFRAYLTVADEVDAARAPRVTLSCGTATQGAEPAVRDRLADYPTLRWQD